MMMTGSNGSVSIRLKKLDLTTKTTPLNNRILIDIHFLKTQFRMFPLQCRFSEMALPSMLSSWYIFLDFILLLLPASFELLLSVLQLFECFLKHSCEPFVKLRLRAINMYCVSSLPRRHCCTF